MRVIITGGTGLIGSALTDVLVHENHEVIILTRNPEKAQGLPAGARAVTWDGRSAEGWGELVNGAGAIVNMAGENLAKRWTSESKKRIFESRLNAGRAVTEAIRQATAKPGVLIQSSAVGYYGLHADEKVTEQAPPGKDFQAEVCIAWEASTAEVESMGVRRVITRTGLVISSKGGALPQMVLPFRFFVGGPVGSGRQWFPWIHISDEVAAVCFLINRQEASGPFNLCSPNPLTNRGFAKVLGNVLHRPAIFPAPAFMMKLMFGEMSTIVLNGTREIPARLQTLGFKFRFPQAEDALKDLYPVRMP